MSVDPVGRQNVRPVQSPSECQPVRASNGLSSIPSSLRQNTKTDSTQEKISIGTWFKSIAQCLFRVPQSLSEFFFGVEIEKIFAMLSARDGLIVVIGLLSLPFVLPFAALNFLLLPIRIPCMIAALVKHRFFA